MARLAGQSHVYNKHNYRESTKSRQKVIKRCEKSSCYLPKTAIFYLKIIFILYAKLNAFMLGLLSFVPGNFWKIIYTSMIMCDYG